MFKKGKKFSDVIHDSHFPVTPVEQLEMFFGDEVVIKLPYRAYPRVQLCFTLPSMTKPYFQEDADINVIMKKYPDINNIGDIPYVNNASASYGDFSDAVEYREALDRVLEAQENFEFLPAKVRDRFSNDVAEFLDFVHDPKNFDEMVSMGIAKKKPEETSQNASEVPSGGTAP